NLEDAQEFIATACADASTVGSPSDRLTLARQLMESRVFLSAFLGTALMVSSEALSEEARAAASRIAADETVSGDLLQEAARSISRGVLTAFAFVADGYDKDPEIRSAF